MVQLQVFSIYY